MNECADDCMSAALSQTQEALMNDACDSPQPDSVQRA